MKDVNLSEIPFFCAPALGGIQKDDPNVVVAKA